MTTCPHCGHDVPEGNYCVRCGADLRVLSKRRPARARTDFAASPGEHLAIPEFVSTLFPQLPRADLWSFRAVLLIGTAAVVALTALGLFPIAVLAAALLVPTVTAIYFYTVDVYEDAHAYVLALTLLWGAVAGVGVGLLTRAVTDADTSVASGSADLDPSVHGVLLPLLSVALALAGPLVLLPYRKFNDVLDGATFGAASAATLVAAQVVTLSVSLLDAGLAPGGATWSWLARILTIAVFFPVLTMSAVGAAAAAFWLRFRAPVPDRKALGRLGNPALAVPVAAALVVAASIGQQLLPLVAWLVELVVLSAGAVLWLRRVLHIGLLEEAAEIEIGPAFRCANCGAMTARHSFCSSCGIALQALPTAHALDPSPRAGGVA